MCFFDVLSEQKIITFVKSVLAKNLDFIMIKWPHVGPVTVSESEVAMQIVIGALQIKKCATAKKYSCL